MWFGSTVRLTVADPDLIREIFCSKAELYEKIEAHPLMKQVEGGGLLSLNGHKWAHHRKIIAPTFHMENLKVCTIRKRLSLRRVKCAHNLFITGVII